MKKIYQVFVSSTYRDLREERTAVMDMLLKADCLPAGMELFPASDDTQWKVIKRVIDQSDYYVVIIAGKYGSEYRGKSYTQREYEYAVSKKKKLIALLHKDIDCLPVSKCEKTEKKQKKLHEFREIAQKRLCDYWITKEELTASLLHSITNLKSQYPQDGWIRATKYNLSKLSEKRNKNLIKQNKTLKEKLAKIKQIEVREKNEPVLIHDGKIKDVVSKRIDDIDERINILFPDKVYSPRHPDNKPFSSQLLINSLSSMGMPLNVSLEVVDSSIPEIIGLKRQVSQLESSHIRRAVATALYKLNQDVYSEDQIQAWGDSYVRRYGHPDTRALVLIDDEEYGGHKIIPLTYKFTKQHLVPDLIKEVLGSKAFSHFRKSCRKKEDARIAEVIIKSVKSLDVNRIHYNTLLSLSKDLALQPPHPWLVPKAFDFESILYDYERASDHVLYVKKFFETDTALTGKYHLRECIHHSSSGILAIYGVYMGCGYMAPFYNLVYHVDKITQGRAYDVFEYSRLKNLPNDLFSQGVEFTKFHDDLLLFRDKVDWKEPIAKSNKHYLTTEVLKLFKVFHQLFTFYHTNKVPVYNAEIKKLLTNKVRLCERSEPQSEPFVGQAR